MSIFDVEHQPRAHRVIQRALASRRMPHAYLFTGPHGVGREMLALRLAQVLLCESPKNVEFPAYLQARNDEGNENLALDACGECDDCRLVQAGTHPDFAVIYRQLNREHSDSTIRKQKALFISIEVLREFMTERIGRRPARGRAKVFVVREAERLTDAAQNSLLKTLEEPPPDTFIILVTAALDRMLPTTQSRCQPVMFAPLPTDFVAQRLLALRPETSPEESTFAARHSAGSLGAALKFIDDGLFATKQNWGEQALAWVRLARGFAPNSLAAPFLADAQTIGKLAADQYPDMSDTDAARAGLFALLAILGGFYQDAQRQATGAAVEIVNADQPTVIDALASSLSSQQLVASMQQIAQADSAIGRNANLELTIETMFIGLAAIAQGHSPLFARQ